MGFYRSVVIALAAACAVAPGDEAEVVSELGCSGFGCNENTPIVAGAPFWEFNKNGVPNAVGLRLVRFASQLGTPYTLAVRDSKLVGLDSAGAVVLDTAAELTRAVITLKDNSGIWELIIDDVLTTPYWAEPFTNATVYQITVRHDSESRALCSGSPNYVVAFVGDRYDPGTQSVTATGPGTYDWIQLPCAGSVPLKMHLARHTESSMNPAKPPVDVGRRQALMNAFTSRLCPGGGAFTGRGEPLYLFDRHDVLVPNASTGPIDFARVESLWSATGPVCVGEHRLVVARSMDQTTANTVLGRIPASCNPDPRLKRCSDIPDFAQTWRSRGLVLTTNPPGN